MTRIEKKETYFAYGSNMMETQMKNRCPSAEWIGKGWVLGYRLCFPRRSRHWQGGVAGLSEDPRGMVEGVLYELTEGDLGRMDEFEGVPQGHYRRKTVAVELERQTFIEAWIYIAISEGAASFDPSVEYIDTMLRGAVEHGLSGDTIQMLRGIRDRP